MSIFALITAAIEKWRSKPRILSFVEAAKAQKIKEQEIWLAVYYQIVDE